MPAQTVVATANILRNLSATLADEVLDTVLTERPDLVALQEWDLPRLLRLRRTGSIRLLPGPGWTIPAHGDGPTYHWVAPVIGGTIVGARSDRFDLLHGGARLLSGFGATDNPRRRFRLEPPRVATIGTFRDRGRAEDGGETAGETVSLLCYHLVPGVESQGRYREDRPRISARHRAELVKVQESVTRLRERGHRVYAAGDSNFDGFRIGGLVSVWEGHPDEPGTHGPVRKIDDVHGVLPASSVRLLTTASDHRAVLATWGESESS